MSANKLYYTSSRIYKRTLMKIIHLQQRHKSPFGMATPEIIDTTVQSQFNLAQEIKKRSEYPVLLEGLYEDINFISQSTSLLFDVVKMLFPQGFPTGFNELTELQKKFLYEEGTVMTLFYLRMIPAVYKTMDKATPFCQREPEAIKHCKTVAKDNGTVTLVYGRDHNFKPYCDKEKIDYETIDTVAPLGQKENSNNVKSSVFKNISASSCKGVSSCKSAHHKCRI